MELVPQELLDMFKISHLKFQDGKLMEFGQKNDIEPIDSNYTQHLKSALEKHGQHLGDFSFLMMNYDTLHPNDIYAQTKIYMENNGYEFIDE